MDVRGYSVWEMSERKQIMECVRDKHSWARLPCSQLACGVPLQARLSGLVRFCDQASIALISTGGDIQQSSPCDQAET